MSSSDAESTVQLAVDVGDPSAEIFLLDGQFQVADRGVGGLRTAQPPGIYKLKVRTASLIQEQMVVLRDEPVSLELEQGAFASPAPLTGTSKTHEYHMSAAHEESQKIHVHAGQGSSIYVFARDWTGGGGRASTGENPARGLQLRTFESDTPIADLETQSKLELAEDACAACRIEVNPGAYRLSARLSNDDVYEACVMAAPEWQTQIFLLQRDERQNRNEPGMKRPDVTQASVFMSKDHVFHPDDPGMRLVETVRQGVINERRVLSGELRSVLRDKLEHPMFGIFGGHLILMDREPDLALLGSIVSNLRNLLNSNNHPDVEALALPCGMYQDGFVFQHPPMLQRSWSLIVEHSARLPHLVPPGSFNFKIANRFTSQPPWLIWKAPEPGGKEDEADLADFKEIVATMLLPKQAESVRRHVLEAVGPQADMLLDVGRKLRSVVAKSHVLDGLINKIEPEAIEALVKSLGLPRANVERLVSTVLGSRKK